MNLVLWTLKESQFLPQDLGCGFLFPGAVQPALLSQNPWVFGKPIILSWPVKQQHHFLQCQEKCESKPQQTGPKVTWVAIFKAVVFLAPFYKPCSR